MSERLRIVVTGLIAQHPHLGGVAWDYVQYPLGLARLGHDVYYLEDSGEWPYLLAGGEDPDSWVARDPAANVRHLGEVMDRFGLGERWMYRFAINGTWHGLAERQRAEVLSSADVLINVSGTLEHPDRYRRIPVLAYIDSDPVFTQARLLEEPGSDFAKRVHAHDVLFSFGERINETEFATDRAWWPTRQPMVLDEWWPAGSPGDACTTVMSWTSYRPIRSRGYVLGQKDVEFRRFVGLARSTPLPLEVALGSLHHAGWETASGTGEGSASPGEVLADEGWRVVDALKACSTVDSYRSYIQGSRAEWSVAKSGYLAVASGWFSCRSSCYLAAGRPVIVQDTGFSDVIPTGEGVLAFRTADEALAGLEAVASDDGRHAQAARAIAAEYFDASRVLPALLQNAASTSVRSQTEVEA